VRRWFGDFFNAVRNSITGFFVGFMTITAIIFANFFIVNVGLSFIALVAFWVGYIAIYARIVRFKWCSPIAFLLRKPRIEVSLST